MNFYTNNLETYPTFLGNSQNNDPFTINNQITDFSELQQPLNECYIVDHNTINYAEIPDIPDTCFNYITTLLRENDLDDSPGATLHDYMTAQISYNNNLDNALIDEIPLISTNHCFDAYHDYLNMFSCNSNSNSNDYNDVNCGNVVNVANVGVMGQSRYHQVTQCHNGGGGNVGGNDVDLYDEPIFGFLSNDSWELDESIIPNDPNLGQIDTLHDVIEGDLNMYCNALVTCSSVKEVGCNDTSAKTRGRKHNEGNIEVENEVNDNGCDDGRKGKQIALSSDWCEQIEKYGDVLLCPEGRSKPGALCGKSKLQNSDCDKEKKSGNSSRVSKKRGSKCQVVDLRALLTRCAQCVARVDLIGAYEILKQIREHSSPYGDFLQRVAHYLANGLEARLEGKGSELTRANEDISSSEVLKANRVFVGSVPFKIMSYYTTNKTIASLAMESSSIHIIDFGIYYGLQWPCIIQNLSKRPNGPPRIRITGIDFPQRGFRPAERIEETGRCLAKYCEKYNVPFEYNAIAQQWETIKLEDLKIEPNEPLVVNCLYRSHNLFDESVDDNSPREEFLRLVRKINPDIFMHAIVNSTSSVPFFLNRFKEVMFHYSALFDVFESTMSREDSERLLLESKLYGNQALNVIACEGIERVERHETYKQWVVRTQRAGFKQIPLDRDLVRRAKAMVKRSFRDEFSYDEDGHWVVQGWKGRILYAISCWKPV